MGDTKEFKRAKMVGWYNPSQLIDTGKRTIISTMFGKNADPRVIAATNISSAPFDYTYETIQTGDGTTESKKRKEIWIDYVSDTGDGFNSTYSVAYSVAKPELTVSFEGEPAGYELKRGNLLIFGGDEVYPTPTFDAYVNRLVIPYQMAFRAHQKNRGDGDKSHVFAVPGNHDWYDSLVSFQNLFCTDHYNKRIFADGWQTKQEIGYFAIKLPHHWWLLGADLQLRHDVDNRQLDYFRSIAKQMDSGDKIVLCVPEPYWVKSIKYEQITDQFEKREKSIELLESIFEGRDIKLYLAGDLHHYRRFEAADGSKTNKITAGGGGAFLHPTHDFDFEKYEKKQQQKPKFLFKKNYPSFEDSKKFDKKNLFLGFLLRNKSFGLLTAVIYFLIAGAIKGKVEGPFTIKAAFKATAVRMLDEPLAMLIVVFLIAGLVFFTDSNSKQYKRIAGIIHGLAHLGAVFVLGWIGYLLSKFIAPWFITWIPNYEESVYFVLVWLGSVALVCGVGGYFAGSMIMGLYLYISMHIFKRHDNEAFSAMKIEDYKNFLRLHIDEQGTLTVYPVKIEKVAKQWVPEKFSEDENPVPKEELVPELIEKPIKID